MSLTYLLNTTFKVISIKGIGKNNVGIYRPVLLTCSLSKVFERTIASEVKLYLDMNKLFSINLNEKRFYGLSINDKCPL